MHTVIVNIEAPIVQYPQGTTTAGTVFALVAPAGAAAIPPQTVAPGATSATFENVPDGTGYTATAQLLDGNSVALGALAVSLPFDLITPTVGIATPTSVSVVVQ